MEEDVTAQVEINVLCASLFANALTTPENFPSIHESEETTPSAESLITSESESESTIVAEVLPCSQSFMAACRILRYTDAQSSYES